MSTKLHWTRCTDKMPMQHSPVWIYPTDDNGVYAATFVGSHFQCINGYAQLEDVTHWMPRPMPPEPEPEAEESEAVRRLREYKAREPGNVLRSAVLDCAIKIVKECE